MKKLLLALVILSASNSFALEVNCEAAVGPRMGRPSTEIAVTYKDNSAYIFQTIEGYTFNGSCSKDSCEISINSDKIGGFISSNGAFSKLNDNRFSMSYFRSSDDTVAEIECQKVK